MLWLRYEDYFGRDEDRIQRIEDFTRSTLLMCRCKRNARAPTRGLSGSVGRR